MLVDIMWPIMSVLEGNPDAPMREAMGWELQVADSADDAVLRDAYADRLHEWGCVKREGDIRKEAKAIRDGKRIPLRRHSPVMGLRYPPGQTNVGTEENPVIRDNQDLAREIIENLQPGELLILDNTPNYAMPGHYDWEIITEHGAPK